MPSAKISCPNCKTTLTCGCKNRTASDGKKCCAYCVNSYEKALKLYHSK